jgi:murein DD-endopeptidase MepM/ murein hydrolase activator NlpD
MRPALAGLLLCLIIFGCAHRASGPSSARAPNSAEIPPATAYRGSTPNPDFDWPVDEARLTRGYFLKDPKRKSKRPHLGIDLAAPRGTPIYASHAGTVIYVGKEFRGFGRMIMIQGRGGWASLYAHLVRARVKEGQQVRQGDLIGDMGKTGRATGVHLHFEIRKPSGPVDPLLYLPNPPKVADTIFPLTETDDIGTF